MRPSASFGAGVAACAATGVVVGGRGSIVVAAVLLGLAALDRRSVLAAVLAAAAVGARFATTDLGDLAGIQSVLGAAGVVGPPRAAASAWLAAAAVVLAAVPRPAAQAGRGRQGAPGDIGLGLSPVVHRTLVAVAGGALAAAVAVGPGPGGELVLRVAATVVAAALVLALGAVDGPRIRPLRSWLGVLAAIVAVALAGWPA